MLQIAVVWILAQCSLVETYRIIRETCCLTIAVDSSTLMTEIARLSETFLNFHEITWLYNPGNKFFLVTALLTHAETQTHTLALSSTMYKPYASMSLTNSDTVSLYHTFHLFFKFVTSHPSWQFKIIRVRYPEVTTLRKESSSSKNAFGSGWWKKMSLILHAAGGRVTGPKLPLSRGVYTVLPDR